MPHAKFSTNGINWTTATFSGATLSGNFVDFENANYYWGALTSSGQIWINDQRTSQLGEFTISSSYPSGLTKLSKFQNKFIAISSDKINESFNLTNWTTTQLTNATINNIISSDNYQKLIIVGNNGVLFNWNGSSYDRIETGLPDNILNGDIRYRETKNITNYNYASWATMSASFGTTAINLVGYGNGLWVATGFSNQIRTSTDGNTWTTVTGNFANAATSLAYGNGLWVAGSDLSQMRISTNGSTWTTVTSNFGGTIRIDAITYGNGLWVAGGGYNQMRISTNGSTWTSVSGGFQFSIQSILALKYGGGIYVGSGNSAVRRSTDGTTWTASNGTFNQNYYGLEYGQGIWVVGSANGVMMTSTDAINWTTITSNFGSNGIYSIAYGNGLWVAVGAPNIIRTSTNGTVWVTAVSQHGISNSFINCVAYGNGIWRAVIPNNSSNGQPIANIMLKPQETVTQNLLYDYLLKGQNALYFSTNMTSWVSVTTPKSSNVNDIINVS